MLADAGWDVERDGLGVRRGIRVVATGERDATIDRSLRLPGLGAGSLEPVASDEQGRIDIAALAGALEDGPSGPVVVCLQAGNVDTGACDDLAAAIPLAHRYGVWVHVDGAFGLWAAACPPTQHLLDGLAAADSWGTDGHEWLNVPYDSGYAFCADPEAHRAAMAYTAASLTGQGQGDLRAPGDHVPESSRRARGFATWAALQALGRSAQRGSAGTSGTDGRKQDRASRPRPIPTSSGQVMAPTGASCRGIDGTPAPVHAHMVQW